MTVPADLLAILVCPKCKGALVHRAAESALDCAACALRYPVRDGIPVMLIDEATPLR
ncbi:MAG: Trm112 family protein [Gemmatimonadaceae bacterium]|nr:Trm112 family protein [Gemmatimonadaceae bacterium]